MKVFISDCEGPISKNDNAFELTSHFIPGGDQLFSLISRYDDVLANVLKRPEYKAGDTLKLVLPFLKAYDVTDQRVREFSAKTLLLIPNAKEAIQHTKKVVPSFIVSTSYEHYIRVLCDTLDFPFENTYCTRMNLDAYDLRREEGAQLKKLATEIARMTMFDIPSGAESLADISTSTRQTIERLDEIFWQRISKMEIGWIYSEVNPVGGIEKAEAVRDIVHKLGLNLTDAMYVGDSITDEEAFKLVKGGGGLTVSFNGNRYAIANAEVAIMSETCITTAVLADFFVKFGKHETLRVVDNWNRNQLKNSYVDKELLDLLFRLCPLELPKVKIVTDQNRETLARESSLFRNRVRGEAAGRLG